MSGEAIGRIGRPEPAPWQQIPVNGPGVQVAYPTAAGALPTITLNLRPDPSRTGSQPVQISTSGNDRDSFAVTVRESDGTTRKGHVAAVALIQEAARNELARHDLSPEQRDQMVELLSCASYLRQRTQFVEDPTAEKGAADWQRYTDASATAARQGRSVSSINFLEP